MNSCYSSVCIILHFCFLHLTKICLKLARQVHVPVSKVSATSTVASTDIKGDSLKNEPKEL